MIHFAIVDVIIHVYMYIIRQFQGDVVSFYGNKSWNLRNCYDMI